MNQRQHLITASRLFIVCLLMSTAALADALRFDIPAQSLPAALKVFADQAKMQLLYKPAAIGNGTSNAVVGDFDRREALRLLLKGTGFEVVFSKGNAATIRPVEVLKSTRTTDALRVVQSAPEPPKEKPPAAEAPAEPAVAEVQVTGSRIRSAIGEQTAQPVLTVTREDIERYGVSSLGEVLRYIPQVSSAETGQESQVVTVIGTPPLDVNSNRVTATLRGAPPGGTLLLVNGRRVAKSGQALGGQGSDAYDIGGIPLSAVERIDVLLDGASAIYGADAVGGVINVILRKNYRGTEVHVGHENTFESDASVRTASITHGFANGKLSGLATVSWEDASAMYWRDRWFLRSFDRRFLGGPDFRDTGFDFGGRGVIISSTGEALPGLDTDTAVIPAGSSGVGLTIADFANSGPLPEPLDYGDYLPYSDPYQRRSIAGSAEYAFSSMFTLFTDVRWGESRSTASWIPSAAFFPLLPADAPGNPFGEPVFLMKYFFDRPLPEDHAITRNQGLTVGLRGELRAGWRYESAISRASTRPDLKSQSLLVDDALLEAAFEGANPPVLLYDSTSRTDPNPAGVLESVMSSTGFDAERSMTQTYDFQADGPLFALPAGDLRMSVGAEYREDNVEFPLPEFNLSIQSNTRYVSGYFAEMRIPLISQRQGWPLLHSLEANVAARHDRYSDFPAATSPRYGLSYRPFRWLLLRASLGEGYKVPTLVQLYRPQSDGAAFPRAGSVLDALRGNQAVRTPPGGFAVTFRGNPELRPERSENATAGLVLDVPFVPGLMLSMDFFDTKYIDRVSSLALADRIVLFPQTVIRGPNLPADPAGWPGPVIGYQDVAFNIASNRVSGYDIGVQYNRPTELGDWTMKAAASKTTRNEIRSAPNRPPTINSATFNLPLQIDGSIFWSHGAFEMGALCSYRGATFGTTLTGPTVPSAIRWDWQGSLNFDRGGSGWFGEVLAGARLSLTIFNVFDAEPPLRRSTFMPDNTVVDSRLRRYSLNLTKSF